MIFDDILNNRAIPPLSFSSDKEFLENKDRIKDAVQKNEYGYIPNPPEHMSATLIEEDSRYAGGKATKRDLIMTLYNGEKSFKIPFCAVIPNAKEKLPAFISISMRESVPDKFLPCEEIIDNGFAVFSFGYESVTHDQPGFSNMLPSFLGINRHSPSAPGKLALWAYFAMRIMDYVETLDCIDKSNIAVIGHERLGKAALLAAAFDERFYYAVANNSGCAGAALSRGKRGEDIHDITNRFPYWFCPRFSKLAPRLESTDFDQNFLLSLIPPRKLLIGSAESDLWSDPESEFLGAYSVSKIYELYGKAGLVTENEFPKTPKILDSGNICYHIRKGESYLTRDDWQVYMNYIKKCMETKNDLPRS